MERSTKRVAIVITFDEGESATTACCGWNPERSGDGKAQLVTFTAGGAEVSSVSALPPYTEAIWVLAAPPLLPSHHRLTAMATMVMA